jgi:HTH-type transcriptional regulator / antitoxin HigA
MKTIEVAVIRNNTEYKNALKRISQIFDAEPGSNEFYELKLLSMEVECFENENFKLPKVDPIEIIEFIIEHRGLRQNALVGILGDKTIVSKVLNRKRPLTLEMIRSFCENFHVPTEVMIKEYPLMQRV